MNENILAASDESALTAEFGAACEDLQGTDFGFTKQREASGFANFGFDPVAAAELRQRENARIASVLEDDTDEWDDEDYDDDWCDDDEDDLVDPFADEDLDYDRFKDEIGDLEEYDE